MFSDIFHYAEETWAHSAWIVLFVFLLIIVYLLAKIADDLSHIKYTNAAILDFIKKIYESK